MRTNEYTFNVDTNAGAFEWIVDAVSKEQAIRQVRKEMEDNGITLYGLVHVPYQGMPMTMVDFDTLVI